MFLVVIQIFLFDMKQLKIQNLLLFLCLIFLFTIQNYGQEKISCRETSKEVGGGSTFFLRSEGKLKNVIGNATFPDGSPTYVTIEIYKNQFNRNKNVDYKEVVQIISDDNKIRVCESDEKGKFEIEGLKDGFYLLKMGFYNNGGFGPEHNFNSNLSQTR